ncbi:hypothetical protein F4861DRAFT_374776 [Xylaria intraflava]|nr:hypothetical protein F4861DRAFT_374776 [Xylaria intraflava]
MCIYYYLHYHHVPPCDRPMEFVVHYSFCPNAKTEAFTSPLSSAVPGAATEQAHGHGNSNSNGNSNSDGDGDGQYQQPCDQLAPAPECDPAMGADYTNPCAAGGCLMSQHCASGGCRLEELGGRWSCCRCQRGGNRFRWCMNRVRRVPDALCSHVVCQRCRPDARGTGRHGNR